MKIVYCMKICKHAKKKTPVRLPRQAPKPKRVQYSRGLMVTALP